MKPAQCEIVGSSSHHTEGIIPCFLCQAPSLQLFDVKFSSDLSSFQSAIALCDHDADLLKNGDRETIAAVMDMARALLEATILEAKVELVSLPKKVSA